MAKDHVLSELKVDKEIPDQDGALGKLRIIYEGISANAWLRPFGLTMKRDDALNRPRIVELNDNCKSSIRDRAKSANCFLGRRHFELDRQELSRDEVLIGRSLTKKSEDDVGGSGLPDERSERRGVSSRSAFLTCRPGTSLGGDVRRPNTGIGNFRDTKVRPYTAQPQFTMRNSKVDLPDLNICQVFGGTSEDDKKSQAGSHCDSRRQVSILEREVVGFRSISAMKEAYRKRVKSTPKPKNSDVLLKGFSEGTNPGNEKLNYMDSKPRTSNGGDPDDKYICPVSARGSLLKPLLSSEDCDVSHGNSCPYKGCFRACLASDEYFENAKSKGELFSPRRTTRPQSNRRRVSYRLRPALRMAFLEQLSIEERAKHQAESDVWELENGDINAKPEVNLIDPDEDVET